MNDNYNELKQFVLRNEIGEEFNFNAEFQYLHYKENQLLGLVAYMKEKDSTGAEYPRFIHVVLDKSIRRSKEALDFILDSFEDLKTKGYEKVVAVIPHWKKHMQIFARKFNFIQYAKDEEFGYWVADINRVLLLRR